jgi:hypothetical protein
MTKPPARKMRAFSSGRDGFWSSDIGSAFWLGSKKDFSSRGYYAGNQAASQAGGGSKATPENKQ